MINKSIEKIYDKKFGSSRMVLDENGQDAKTEFWNEKTINHKIL